MDRKISFSDVQKAVDNAYEAYKSVKKGEIDSRVKDYVDAKDFGIAVVLADGRIVKRDSADKKFVIGDIARVAVATALASQYTPEEIVKKSGTMPKIKHSEDDHKIKLHINKHALRATSAIEPTGDSDGKYNLLVDTLIDLTAGEPVLNDKVYESLTKEANEINVVDRLAERDYELYDDPELVVNVYNKLRSLQLSSVEVATMGATIAADGVNPVSKDIVFDGSKAATITTLLATVGNKRRKRAQLMEVGLPVVHSFGGGVLAVLPGFGAIAAYAPAICDEVHASAKGYQAIASIAKELQLNIFASARVSVE
ncbi:MAG: glutaminase [Muribaculaceae bacterium]|nr:glutaminase [Muribaculaceae bacterium]